jgi:hypothetical protein
MASDHTIYLDDQPGELAWLGQRLGHGDLNTCRRRPRQGQGRVDLNGDSEGR